MSARETTAEPKRRKNEERRTDERSRSKPGGIIVSEIPSETPPTQPFLSPHATVIPYKGGALSACLG